MKALIFGVTGQDGHYLRELLVTEGISVFGVARSGGDARVDVSDRTAVLAVIRDVRPDYVFHLAATSSTAHEHLWANHAAISTGTLAILDAVEQEAPHARVLLAGSGLQFVNHGLPLDEDSALDHSSPYVIARNHSLFAARYYRTRGLKVWFAYLFNHDSPLRSNHHLNMKIAEAAVRAASCSSERLLIGDPDAEKEFNFAGDIAAALWALIRQETNFECVVGSGEAAPVRHWLDACYRIAGLDWKEHVVIDPAYRSPYPRLVSNPVRLFNTGWNPRFTFRKLAGLMMGAARERLAGGKSHPVPIASQQ